MSIDLSPGGINPMTPANFGAALNAARHLREGISTAGAWLNRWASHVGECKGGDHCSCGLTYALNEARYAMAQAFPDDPPAF